MLGAGFVAGGMKSLVNSGANTCRGRALGPDPAFDDDPGRQSALPAQGLEGRGVEIIGTGRVRGLNQARAWSWTPAASMPTLIILATGVHPNVSFLEGTGAEIRSGS